MSGGTGNCGMWGMRGRWRERLRGGGSLRGGFLLYGVSDDGVGLGLAYVVE